MALRVWICQACSNIECEKPDLGEKPTECDQPGLKEEGVEPNWILSELDLSQSMLCWKVNKNK